MAVVVISDKVTPADLKLARQEYDTYVKIVADLDRNVIAIGGEYHADAEKILINQGSKQTDLWGGGIDLTSNTIETIALINIRPRYNNDSQEIIDPSTRQKFIDLVKRKFSL